MADEKKKNIFDKAIDMVSNRDEKAAAEEAAKKTAEAQKTAEAAKLQAAKAATEKAAAQKQVQEAQRRAEAAEAQTRKLHEEELRRGIQANAAKAAEAAKQAALPKFIADHTIKAGETLSHVALKHYGNAARPYWMLIYEANKATIGGNPNVIREGMALKIPELPEELKKK